MAAKNKPKPIQFQIGWPGLIAIVISAVCVLLWTFVLGFWMGQKVFTGCDSSKVKTTVVSPDSRSSEPAPSGLAERTDSLLYGNETSLFDQNEKALEDLKEKLKQEQPQKEESIPSEVISPPNKPPQKAEEGSKAGQPAAEKKKPAKASIKAKAIKTEKVAKEKREELKEYFSLQIASYKTMTQARKEASRWQKKGYHVQIKRADLGRKGIWYRVLLGKYKSLERAKKEASRLASREGLRSYVVKGGK